MTKPSEATASVGVPARRPMTPTKRRAPERTCVGCRKTAAASALVRLVIAPGDGSGVVVDAAGGAFGRGVYVHPSPDCVARACKGGFAASLKQAVRVEADVLCAEIRRAYERRAVGLILGARRAGHLAIGGDAAEEATKKGSPLVVLAIDAGADVRRRFAQAQAQAFGTKISLGELFGQAETAVFAVRHDGVSKALSEALLVATAVSGSAVGQTKKSGSEE